MEALHEWHEFYILLGTAGATLLALLFVAVSLGTGFLNNKDQQGTRTFMSPVVIHFTSVFFLSAVCLVPSHGPVFFAVLIAGTAVVGVAALPISICPQQMSYCRQSSEVDLVSPVTACLVEV